MGALAQDLRYALRQFRKNPGFAFTSIIILALGICASVSIFGFVDAALIKPLPYSDPSRLVWVTESVAMIARANLSFEDYADWKKLNQVFSSFDIYATNGYLLTTRDGTEPVPAVKVSDGFFRTLGVSPFLGRDFHPGEDQPAASQTVLLSYSTWLKRFGARHDVVGQTVTLSGVPHTIIGVLPASFQFAPLGKAEFWTTARPVRGCTRGCHALTGIARLKDGVSVDTARANIQAIARQLELQYPITNRGQGGFVELLAGQIVSDIRPVLLALLGGAGLLLLIACVNVSSLLLVRSESRKREIAVRGALGASRLRLIQQFTTDGFVLVAAGAILGVLAAQGAMHILTSLISTDMLGNMPYLAGLGVNLHVLSFVVAISLLAMILFSVTPMLRLPLSDIRQGLAEGGRGHAGTLWRRFGANLVVVELAVAVVLLVGAGLLGQSFYRLLHVNVGFQTDHLATLAVALSDKDYPKDPDQIAVAKKILTRVESLPGVQSAGTTSVLPVSFNGNTAWIRIVGRPYNGEHNEVNQREVSPDLFKTLKAKLLRGRYFTETDEAGKPLVVMINETLARKYFPGEDPVGKKIGDVELAPKSLCEVIGVVEDVKDGSLDAETWPAIYYSSYQNADDYFALVVRTSQLEAALLPSLVAAVHEVGGGLGTLDVATMADRINNSPASSLHRSAAWLVGGFATLALLLGVIGLYSVIAYSVSQRTREIGVRMALGAQRSSVYQLILREAARLIGTGIAAGLAGSLLAANLIRGLLFGVRSWDGATLAGVAVVLAICALLASYIPARNAARVDPSVALRYE